MASRGDRSGRSLGRRVGTRRPRKTLAVFCEGTETEPDYLEALKREPAVRDTAAVDLRIETRRSGSVPLTLVRKAVDARDRARIEESEIDEFWCVFDVEWPINHPDLRDALELARANEISVAVSNPCFELWLILHFQDRSAWLDNVAARRLRRSLDGQLRKSLDGATYMPRRHEAAARASKLEARHEGNGTVFPNDNPSSGMYRLIEAVEIPPA
jgi:hypothetical protein